MRLFAPDQTRAVSRFWYFLGRVERLKKANGEILAVNQVIFLVPNVWVQLF
jgi:large subunit ribosomal protein L18Ae